MTTEVIKRLGVCVHGRYAENGHEACERGSVPPPDPRGAVPRGAKRWCTRNASCRYVEPHEGDCEVRVTDAPEPKGRSERELWTSPIYAVAEMGNYWRITLPDKTICPVIFATENGALGGAAIHRVLTEEHARPIPMLLWCPECGERHIDVGPFAYKAHHTHACQACGMTWRPAIASTVGVQFLPGFKNEPPTTEETST